MILKMQETTRCTKCNSLNSNEFQFCTTCGARLGIYCPQCGTIVPPDSRFCPECAYLCGSGRFGKTQHKIETTQQIIKCHNCNSQVISGRRFCTSCGSRLFVTCPNCGENIEPTTVYCIKCGHFIQDKRNKK